MITPGRQICGACAGSGYVHPAPPPHAWLRCAPCDGVGDVWKEGGPKFDAPLELGECTPGDVVEVASGHRGRVLWHMPRPTKKRPAEITFVGVIDDFDEHESDSPTAFHSRIGVRSVRPRVGAVLGGAAADAHDHEKDADLVDPFARRQRQAAGEGDLL